jgi:hypothetical protein
MTGRSLAAVSAFLLLGCVSPTATDLEKPRPVPAPIGERALIKGVTIADPDVDDRETQENSLTLNLVEFMRAGSYFGEVEIFPSRMTEGSLLLHFSFDRFKQQRRVHPAYFPVSLLTATLYIWFGGPIVIDTAELSGRLSVEDVHGVLLSTAKARIERHESKSFYSRNDFGITRKARTELVEQLLDDVGGQLKMEGPRR